MTTYYKAVRPDYRSFYDRLTRWEVGRTTAHPVDMSLADRQQMWSRTHPEPSRYLSASVCPTDLPGCSWPLRLLEVEPVGEAWTPDPTRMPNKRAAAAWTTVRELSPDLVLGPQAAEIQALAGRMRALMTDSYSVRIALRSCYMTQGTSVAWDWLATQHPELAAHPVIHSMVNYTFGGGVGEGVTWGFYGLYARHVLPLAYYRTLTMSLADTLGAPLHPKDKR